MTAEESISLILKLLEHKLNNLSLVKSMMLHCLTAVFNRQNKTFKSINDIYIQAKILNHKIIFWIIEAGDEIITKKTLSDFPTSIIKIIKVPETTYWTSGMQIGIDLLKKNSSNEDIIILFNNDIRVPKNTIFNLQKKIFENPRSAISPISIGLHSRKTVSTGVKVKNWFFSIHKPMFVNLKRKHLRNLKATTVNFMTQRLFGTRAETFNIIGNYKSHIFPHYGGDDELTHRMGKNGIKVILDPSFYIFIDEKDTGLNSSNKKLNFMERLKSLYYVKSTNNLMTTIKFSLFVAPIYTQPLNVVFMIIKSFIRAMFFNPKK